MAYVGSQLVTSGATGHVGVATGTGATVRQATTEVYRIARKVIIPNLRYRTDIGQGVMRSDWDRLHVWGWLDGSARPAQTP